MCSHEMVWYLTQFVQLLGKLVQTKDTSILELIEMVDHDARYYLDVEKEQCLDTDPILRNMETIFERARKATFHCVKTNKWELLQSLAAELIVVRDALKKSSTKGTT